MCLNKAYSTVRIVKCLSDNFPIQNGLQQGDALSPLLFNFALKYVIGKVQVKQMGPKLNGTQELLAYADNVNLLGDNIDNIKNSRETLIVSSKKVCVEVNVEKTKYIFLSSHQNAGQNYDRNSNQIA
jgi:hypothetical protein